ncbi:MAG: SulP family inorganic anion transporter [Flavobacterium sp.]|uniref:SulP family inorganic anion transporter n=1 Tax=Flavobacterium sp. TaxID=239 RepID=UPI0022BD1948|nr:SulP family inorganic anion transporter [Flavobacterium sp.]MCZ8196733.1 SulP family inorganic anion transporter [Flavobacterium sp.]
MTKKINLFANLKSDFASGLVVFLVALPLCLGIAMASGAPLFSGIISGIIGGIVVGYLSQSHLSVSGPAAGLTAIVLTSITDLGAFNIFLLAVVLAGLIQLVLGFLKAGSISNYFPNNVIEGMLAGIGVIILLKQIPHAFGYDADYEGDMSFNQADNQNTFSEILNMVDKVNFGAVIITLVSLLILIIWPKIELFKKIKVVPPALVAVIVSILINEFFIQSGSSLQVLKEHLVSLPVPQSVDDFKAIIVFPDFSQFANPKVWIVAMTIAIVASIETLLCIEASDRMDAQKRYTNTNVELKAQGIGNLISGLLGGLPMTSVVVRTTANNAAGAKSKMSTIIHGILLLVSVLSIPFLLNKIPLATLAAVLLMIGYKLAVPNIKHFAKYMPSAMNVMVAIIVGLLIAVKNSDNLYLKVALGVAVIALIIYIYFKAKNDREFAVKINRNQYLYFPFFATIIAVVFTDLLKGVALGMIISVYFVLKGNMQRAYVYRNGEYKDGDVIHIDLAEEVSFLNKAAIKQTLTNIPENSNVIIDASKTVYIDYDVLTLIKEFKKAHSKTENIKVKLVGFKKVYNIQETGEEDKHVFVEAKDKPVK